MGVPLEANTFVRTDKPSCRLGQRTVKRVAYLPFGLAVLGSMLGGVSWTIEPALFGAVGGYFLGKLVQSLVWTLSGPRTAA